MSIYTKDIENKDLLYDPEFNYQVMMEWEKPYMNSLIKKLNPYGDVLEIGFGLGYSADAIQKYDIKSHTIIEADEQVFQKAIEWSKLQKHKVNLVKGYWQDVLSNLGKFDCIFFDDAPSEKFKDKKNMRIYKFVYNLLQNHVNKKARMTWFADKDLMWLCQPGFSFSAEIIDIEIPKHCKYVKDNKLSVPLLVFEEGCMKNIKRLGMGNNLEVIAI